jgi:hypothetical protein
MIVDFVRRPLSEIRNSLLSWISPGGRPGGANVTERVQAITGFDIRRKADDVVRQ